MAAREEVSATQTQINGNAFSPMLGSRVLTYADEDSNTERNIYDIPDFVEPPETTPAPPVCFSYNKHKTSKKLHFCLI